MSNLSCVICISQSLSLCSEYLPTFDIWLFFIYGEVNSCLTLRCKYILVSHVLVNCVLLWSNISHKQLKGRRYILVHGFKGFSKLCPVNFDRTSWWQNHTVQRKGDRKKPKSHTTEEPTVNHFLQLVLTSDFSKPINNNALLIPI